MTAKLTLFNPPDIENHKRILNAHLPKGRVWESAWETDSNLGRLQDGLSVENYRSHSLVNKLNEEFNINKTLELIEDWERAVGIPDPCFGRSDDINIRREQIIQKLTNFGGVQTDEDFIRVAALFGFDITIKAGVDVGVFPLTFPIVFFPDRKTAAHTIFVIINNAPTEDNLFPLPFPIPFSTTNKSFLECIFKRLAPANVQIIIKNEGEI